MLMNNYETEEQFKEILVVFKIDLMKYDVLSRCVKCNNSELVFITPEEAKTKVKFIN